MIRFIVLTVLLVSSCASAAQPFYIHTFRDEELIRAQDLEYVISVENRSTGIFVTFWASEDMAITHDQMQQIACVSRNHVAVNSSLTVTGWIEDSDSVMVAMVGYGKLMALDCSKRVDWPTWADEYYAH